MWLEGPAFPRANIQVRTVLSCLTVASIDVNNRLEFVGRQVSVILNWTHFPQYGIGQSPVMTVGQRRLPKLNAQLLGEFRDASQLASDLRERAINNSRSVWQRTDEVVADEHS